jgi:hypothetical protein
MDIEDFDSAIEDFSLLQKLKPDQFNQGYL